MLLGLRWYELEETVFRKDSGIRYRPCHYYRIFVERAITDTNYFLKILAACLLLILLHRAFSLIAAYSDKFGNLIKGHDRVILRDGELLWDAMKKSSLSEHDVMQSLRLNAKTEDVRKILMARIERNGDISVIMEEEN